MRGLHGFVDGSHEVGTERIERYLGYREPDGVGRLFALAIERARSDELRRRVGASEHSLGEGDEILVTWRAIPKDVLGPWTVYYYPGEVVLTHLTKKSGGATYGSTWWNAKGDVVVKAGQVSLVSIYNCVGTSQPPNTGSGDAPLGARNSFRTNHIKYVRAE